MSAGADSIYRQKIAEFEQRAAKVARGDALPYTGAKLIREMEEALHEAVEAGAPEEEIGDLGVAALAITRRVMAARREQQRSIEEEIKELSTKSIGFAKLLSEDRARSAS